MKYVITLTLGGLGGFDLGLHVLYVVVSDLHVLVALRLTVQHTEQVQRDLLSEVFFVRVGRVGALVDAAVLAALLLLRLRSCGGFFGRGGLGRGGFGTIILFTGLNLV